MPGLLTHYIFSYFIASRVFDKKKSIFIAIFGLLPDIDAIFRVHRWISHSIVLASIIGVFTIILIYHYNQGYAKYSIMGLILYSTHIFMDLFTGYTPLLWPLTDKAYMINLDLNGIVSSGGIGLSPEIILSSKLVDFSIRPQVVGPIVSNMGIIVTIGIFIIIILEFIKTNKMRLYSNP